MSMTQQTTGRRREALETISTNGIALLCGFGASLVLARLLGPGGRGEVAAAMLCPQMFIYLSTMGIESATIYYSARSDTNASAILGNSLLFAIAQAGLVVPLGYLLLPLLLQEQSPPVVAASRAFLWVVPPSLIAQYGSALLQGRLHIRAYNVARSVLPVGYLLGILVLFFNQDLTVEAVLTVQLALVVVVMVLTLAALWALGVAGKPRIDWVLGGKMLRYGLREHIGSMSQLANLRLDQLLLAAFLPAAQLGLYVVAVSTTHVLRVLPYAARILLMPRIAAGVDSLASLEPLKPTLRKYWLLTVATGFGLAIFLPWLIPLVFGSEFTPSVLPAVILVLAAILLGGSELVGSVARGLGAPGLVSQAQTIGLAGTGAGLLMLLPPFGIVGAALATFVSYAVMLAYLAYALQRDFGVAPGQLLRPLRSDLIDLRRELRLLLLESRAAVGAKVSRSAPGEAERL